MLFFYGIRGTLQSIYTFKFSKNFFWDYPGFPSLLVSYGEQSDFYYSGHCGFIIMLGYMFTKEKKWKKTIRFFWAIGFFFVAFVLLSCNVHYSIGKWLV